MDIPDGLPDDPIESQLSSLGDMASTFWIKTVKNQTCVFSFESFRVRVQMNLGKTT